MKAQNKNTKQVDWDTLTKLVGKPTGDELRREEEAKLGHLTAKQRYKLKKCIERGNKE